MDHFRRLAFTKDEADQLMARCGADAISAARLIRHFEASALISRFRKGSSDEGSVRIRRPRRGYQH